MKPVHVSVMPNEVKKYMVPRSADALIIDGTLGEGGHSEMFLKEYATAKVVGIDADSSMVERASRRLQVYGERYESHVGWTDEILRNWHEAHPDMIFMDLGISSYHYQERGKGFSFSATEPLDMRLNSESEEKASDLVNNLREEKLADIIYNYGEERYSRRIARRIVEYRQETAITESAQLAEIVYRAVPQQARHRRIHPATRTFQALRIAVNKELDHLANLLDLAPSLLAPGGLLGVISFHSLEDRMVKQAFRKHDKRFGGEFEVLTRKPLVPSEYECQENQASRSAKFRVLYKTPRGEER